MTRDRAVADESVEIVRESYAAFNAGDLDGQGS